MKSPIGRNGMDYPSELPRKICYSEHVVQKLKILQQKAARLGRVKEFRRALAKIRKSLLTAPLPPDESANVFGEHSYTLQHLKLRMCVAAVPPLVVQFGVSEEKHTHKGQEFIAIYVAQFILLS